MALRLWSLIALLLAVGPLQAGYVITDLGTLGGASSGAFGVNSSGQVVGYAYLAGDASYHAFLYGNGHMTDLGTLGGSFSIAFAVNDMGQVTGYGETPTGSNHAYLFNQGTMNDLGTLGGTFSFGQGINNLGEVVGESALPRGGLVLPFSDTGGLMQPLG